MTTVEDRSRLVAPGVNGSEMAADRFVEGKGNMTNVVFVVGKDTPLCVHDPDFVERNTTFLDSVDPGYFDYLAKVHLAGLEDDSQHAAIALRTAYHHGLETFFALLFAAVQATPVAYAWALKYNAADLRWLCQTVTWSEYVRNLYGLNPVTWDGLSGLVNRFNFDAAKLSETKQLFADLWRRFAGDFVREEHGFEYNSIKHGFRLRPGGFGLALGREPQPGVPPPEQEMKTLANSKFGSSFFTAEHFLKPPPNPKGKRNSEHFRTRRRSLNWSPEAAVIAVQLLSMSINNVLSFMKIQCGQPGAEVRFIRPSDVATFEAPWSFSVGVFDLSMDPIFANPDPATFASKASLLRRYDDALTAARKGPSGGAGTQSV
jgi:hypothetical protein